MVGTFAKLRLLRPLLNGCIGLAHHHVCPADGQSSDEAFQEALLREVGLPISKGAQSSRCRCTGTCAGLEII